MQTFATHFPIVWLFILVMLFLFSIRENIRAAHMRDGRFDYRDRAFQMSVVMTVLTAISLACLL